MSLSTADAIALASLVTGWLCSLALVWWTLASQQRQVSDRLAAYKVEVERRLGERVTVEHLDARLQRFEDVVTAQFAELRAAMMPGGRR